MPEGSESRMIIRARAVVTMDGAPVENGAIALSGDRIVDVGKFSEVSAGHSGQEIIDLGEQVLLPGLINAHCHLDYTCLRGKIPPQKSFTNWIRAINAEKSKLSPEDYVSSINEGFKEAKKFGTTTIANLTAFPELIRRIPGAPTRTWWFAELIDVRSPSRATKLVDSAVELLKSEQNYGLAPHALFTASRNLYQRCEEAGERNLLTTHLAESREEMEMFRDASGPLYEFLEGIGRDMGDCGHGTPLECFLRVSDSSNRRLFGNQKENNWLVAHLNELTEGDFELLKKMTTEFHVVHSPRSHDYFGHTRFPFERLHAIGFNVCLGTDSLASNENLSLFAEMRAFQRNASAISPEKVLEMVTVNSASALGQQNTLGRLRPGFRADLIAIPCTEGDELFAEIVAFEDEINWMMVNGKTVEPASACK
jgi:cytosine/adenosine deaminase-related metal-dependent hydrolase